VDLLAEKTDRTFDEYVAVVRGQAPFLDFAPIVSISALTGQRAARSWNWPWTYGGASEAHPTPELNRVMQGALSRQEPPEASWASPRSST